MTDKRQGPAERQGGRFSRDGEISNVEKVWIEDVGNDDVGNDDDDNDDVGNDDGDNIVEETLPFDGVDTSDKSVSVEESEGDNAGEMHETGQPDENGPPGEDGPPEEKGPVDKEDVETPDDDALSPVPDSGLFVEDLRSGPTSLDAYTHEDYIAASTQEYRDFAEELAMASTDDVTQKAVAASIPGVGSGLIGFDDVTGQRSVTEEDVELAEQQAVSDLTVRVGTGLILIGIFLGGLMLGRGWFTGVAIGVMILSLGELYATMRTRGYAPVALFGFLGVIGAAIGTLRGGVEAIGVATVFTLVATGLIFGVTTRRRPLVNAAVTMLGMTWVVMLTFFIAIAKAEHYIGLILLIVLLTAFSDIGAYAVGRMAGRRQIAPRISPSKTVEGFVGGIVTTILMAAIMSTFPALFQVDLTQALILGLAVSILGPIGDAAESVVKRALDVKDMGSLLPGHGGMLDRIDALLFVVPGAYVLLDFFGKL